MKAPGLSRGFPKPGSLFSVLTSLFSASLLFLSIAGAPCGCSSGSDGDAPQPDDSPSGPIHCSCIADVYLDEWKPDENTNGETRFLLATNKNVHHGIARGLLKFSIPESLTPSEIKKAEIFFSGCSHCNTGGLGGLVGFYAMDDIFSESLATWNDNGGGVWDDSVHSEAMLPEGKTWNEAVNGAPAPDVQGFDITALLQAKLEKVRTKGIVMRFVDEHQIPYTHQNIASRESADERDFAPFILISTEEEPVQVSEAGHAFVPFEGKPRNIQYGPYSMKVTESTAIIAWEEQPAGGTLQHVEEKISNLEPQTEYSYRVNGATQPGRFVTRPPSVQEEPSPFSFFVWGDSRSSGQISTELVESMLVVDPEASFALHTGDMVGNGDILEDWSVQWWAAISPLIRYLPIYPTMGNHELNSSWYRRYFSSLGGNGTNYSFDWGNVHFVILDSNVVNFGTEEQMAWLEEDLEQNVDADFTVVSHHIPVFRSSPAGGEGMPYLQDRLPPLYEAYGVDLVFSGDVHSFQHHLRNGVHYFISAGGGEHPEECGLPIDGTTLMLAKAYHYLNCRVEDRTMHLTAYDAEGDILEQTSVHSGTPQQVRSSVAVESDRADVGPNERFTLDIYLDDVEDLDQASFELAWAKEDLAFQLVPVDGEPASAGVQAVPGELGGIVEVNQADEEDEILAYSESSIGGAAFTRVKVASASFDVPANAGPTAFYMVPIFALKDSLGNDIPYFLGGVKITIRPSLEST